MFEIIGLILVAIIAAKLIVGGVFFMLFKYGLTGSFSGEGWIGVLFVVLGLAMAYAVWVYFPYQLVPKG